MQGHNSQADHFVFRKCAEITWLQNLCQFAHAKLKQLRAVKQGPKVYDYANRQDLSSGAVLRPEAAAAIVYTDPATE